MAFIQKHRLILLFIAVSLLVSGYFIDLWANGNTSARVLPIVSYIDDGMMQIDKNEALAHDKCYVNGHFYSDKAPLPTYVVIPFVGIAHSLGLLPEVKNSILSPELYAFCGFLGGTLPFLGILLLTFLGLKKNFGEVDPLLVLLLFLSSFVFIYAGTFFGHVFSAFLLLYSYVKLQDRHFFISGIFIGLAFASEYTLGLIGFLWGIQLLVRYGWKQALSFSLGTLPGIVFILGYNYYYTGSALDMLYKFVPPGYDFMKDSYGMSSPSGESLWGLSFSGYRGMFFYTPILILIAYYSFKTILKKKFIDIATNYLIIPIIASFLLIASYKMWWGGWSWGPRHLVTITVLLLYQGIILLKRHSVRPAFIYGFILVGCAINFGAKITIQYSVPTEVNSPIHEIWENNILKGFFNPNSIGTYFFKLSPAASAQLFFVVLLVSSVLLLYFSKKWQRSVQEN